ncbi:MAG: hypothetical protein ABW203_05855 [Novosphingobium sp.]
MTDPKAEPPPIDLQAFRARQRSRNRVLGTILGGLAVLFFVITLVKLGIRVQGG